ncbi:MAG: dihydropteroate synthase [Clostridia bacterium]|nr:dihydropteroate synthase [Clostridia bacterium]
MIIGEKTFTRGTHVMAILNLTPDSFWKNSRVAADDALFAAERAIEEGAEILDIGAQSTRPGYTEVSAEEEISRFANPVREIKKRFDIPLSVDTYFSLSARAALDEGADMINDVYGLTHDGDMAEVIAKYNASVCIMHNAKKQLEGDIFPQITAFLQNSVNLAIDAGIDKNKICLDGGIGFAKDRLQNLELLASYDRLSVLGYPLLLGTSRKSLFGGDVNDRLEPTLKSTKLSVKKGIMFVRVHDVKQNVQAIKEARDEYGMC